MSDDADAVGYASLESMWANMVKGRDALRALPDVEKSAPGGGATHTDGGGATGGDTDD